MGDEELRKQQIKMDKEAIQFTLDENEKDEDMEEENVEEFEEEQFEDDNDGHPMNVISNNEHGSVGSTVVFCIVQYDKNNDNYKITTVNLGDSRAILLRNIAKEHQEEHKGIETEQKQPQKVINNLELVELTKDHKPDNVEERQRIIKAGGHVKFNRVDGDLALSRAIGDTRYKQNASLPMEEQKISCVPTITHSVCQSGDYLMVFCDGIVEYKDNEDVFKFMAKSLNETELKEIDDLNEESICSSLRESELTYLTKTESLGLIPKHNVELKGLNKTLYGLTEWALDTGSKDNMTALVVKVGKTKINNTVYHRIWSPCDFYQHKVQFNNIGEEIKDKDKITLDRFMRLFEADCSATGWNMSDKYQNALLQKILYLNDLITNNQQKGDIEKLIDAQNKKLIRLELDDNTKKKGKKRKTMDDSEEDDDLTMDDNESPRKRRKLDTD